MSKLGVKVLIYKDTDILAKLKYEQYTFGIDHSAEIKRIQDLIGITDDFEDED